MSYKSNFRPLETLVDGRWSRFEPLRPANAGR
jgi:arginyl-tRNA--protein-N-Asp/Glu arginylyltransferase